MWNCKEKLAKPPLPPIPQKKKQFGDSGGSVAVSCSSCSSTLYHFKVTAIPNFSASTLFLVEFLLLLVLVSKSVTTASPLYNPMFPLHCKYLTLLFLKNYVQLHIIYKINPFKTQSTRSLQ